jgi:hypothetical protein
MDVVDVVLIGCSNMCHLTYIYANIVVKYIDLGYLGHCQLSRAIALLCQISIG